VACVCNVPEDRPIADPVAVCAVDSELAGPGTGAHSRFPVAMMAIREKLGEHNARLSQHKGLQIGHFRAVSSVGRAPALTTSRP
jgi:hypothetical protein